MVNYRIVIHFPEGKPQTVAILKGYYFSLGEARYFAHQLQGEDPTARVFFEVENASTGEVLYSAKD